MKKKRKSKPRIYVELTAVWGNDDADSNIKISRRRWQQIKDGAEYSHSTWSYYEGMRYHVYWSFSGGNVSIDGDDGRQCLVEVPVGELIVRVNQPE